MLEAVIVALAAACVAVGLSVAALCRRTEHHEHYHTDLNGDGVRAIQEAGDKVDLEALPPDDLPEPEWRKNPRYLDE